MTNLYTYDLCDELYASEDADLIELENHDAAEAYFAQSLDGLKITGWVAVDFPDCWIKIADKPAVNSDGYAVIDGILCNVQSPGSHPGGNKWWLTPIATVYAPLTIETD